MSKEVAKVNSAIAMFGSNDAVPDYIDMEKTEAMEAADLEIPRLAICQAMSEVRKKSSPSYIEGIEEGNVYNTLTRQIYGNEVVVVPIHYQKDYVVWLDRTKAADNAFRGSFSSLKEAQEAIRGLPDDEAKIAEVVETPVFYVFVMTERGPEEAIITMPKSGWKTARRWNSLVRLAGGPRYARGYKLSTVEVDGPKGTYWAFNVQQLGYTPEDIYKKAEALAESIASGAKAVKYGAEDEGEGAPAGGQQGASGEDGKITDIEF